MARYTEAHNKATQKYQKKRYDNILFRVNKGEKDIFKAMAAACGLSLAAFLRAAAYEYHDKHKKQ